MAKRLLLLDNPTVAAILEALEDASGVREVANARWGAQVAETLASKLRAVWDAAQDLRFEPEQLAGEMRREAAQRHNVYPRLVEKGSMSRAQAQTRIAMTEHLAEVLAAMPRSQPSLLEDVDA